MLKYNQKFLGIAVLAFAFSVAICSLDINGINGVVGNTNTPDILCGIDLKSFVPNEDQSSTIVDFASWWNLHSRFVEPHLPILAFGIFKVPKSA